jgi:hypothetical protein
MNPIHTITYYFFKYYFNIILSSLQVSQVKVCPEGTVYNTDRSSNILWHDIHTESYKTCSITISIPAGISWSPHKGSYSVSKTRTILKAVLSGNRPNDLIVDIRVWNMGRKTRHTWFVSRAWRSISVPLEVCNAEEQCLCDYMPVSHWA